MGYVVSWFLFGLWSSGLSCRGSPPELELVVLTRQRGKGDGDNVGLVLRGYRKFVSGWLPGVLVASVASGLAGNLPHFGRLGYDNKKGRGIRDNVMGCTKRVKEIHGQSTLSPGTHGL